MSEPSGSGHILSWKATKPGYTLGSGLGFSVGESPPPPPPVPLPEGTVGGRVAPVPLLDPLVLDAGVGGQVWPGALGGLDGITVGSTVGARVAPVLVGGTLTDIGDSVGAAAGI